MNNIQAASAILEQASLRLQTARRVTQQGSVAYGIRSAQECAELSLKAALRFVGIEYPKKHDVSAGLLAAKKRFPDWFDVEKLAKMGTWLAERREPAMYGNEAEGKGPDELFSQVDAEKGLSYAEEIYRVCKKLIKR